MSHSKAISSMIAIISLVLLVMGLSGSFLFWNVATSETFKTTVQSETQRAVSPASTGFEIVDVDFVAKTIQIKNSGCNVIDSDYIYIFLNGSLSVATPDDTEINPGEILTLTLTDSIEDYDIMVTGPHGTSDEFYTGSVSCGNGVVEFGEDCEVGVPLGEDCTNHYYHNPGGLSCTNCQFDTSGCTAVCGNGPPTEPGEVCDDGDNSDTYYTENPTDSDKICVIDDQRMAFSCLWNYCGDGYLNTSSEECDDGNNIDGDGCSATCINEVFLFCISCTECTAAIANADPGDTVTLLNDITEESVSVCIDFVDKEQIIFDCNGNVIDGDGGPGIGINLGSDTFPSGADSNTVKNCTLSDWEFGIALTKASDYNNITNITVTSNTIGILISQASDWNNITNVTTINNNYGFEIINSGGNIIKDSKIVGNGQYGMRLDEAGQGNPNWIYNNIFNNTNNIDFLGTVFDNDWNFPSPATGPNIVGGPDIGGNYWGRPDGTGYSDTCTLSTTLGFCENAWDVLNEVTCSGAACSGNTDWLPLTKRCGTDGLFMYGICWQPGGFEQNCTIVCSNYGLTCYDPDWSSYVEDCSLHAAFGWTCSQCNLRPDPPDPSQRTDNNWCYYTQPSNNFECIGWGNSLRRICPCQ